MSIPKEVQYILGNKKCKWKLEPDDKSQVKGKGLTETLL